MTLQKKKYDVVGLGSCTMDIIFDMEDIMRMEMIDRDGIERKYACIENSSKLNVKSVKFYPGGSAANIAADLAEIGMSTSYFGGIGNDTNGKACLEDLRKHMVDVTGVKVFNEDSTAVSVILMTPWGKDRSIMAYKGANDLFQPEHVPVDHLKSCRCFVWTSLTSDFGLSSIEKSMEIAKAAGAIIAGAPSISIVKKRHSDAMAMMRKCEITSLNDEELQALTGSKDVIASMKALLDIGLKIVNVTFGKAGQWVTDGKTLVKTTPPKIFPKDTTGAGDATMAGMIYGYLEKKPLAETAKIAATLSAMEIEGTGVRNGIPHSYEELLKFINTHEFPQEIMDFPKSA